MPTLDVRAVGRGVKEARERAHLTQAQLAEAADITDETVSRLERGAYEPSLSTMVAIAEALKTTVDTLIRAESSAKPVRKGAAPSGSAAVRQLEARAAQLTQPAQRALLRVAELLPHAPRKKTKKSR